MRFIRNALLLFLLWSSTLPLKAQGAPEGGFIAEAVQLTSRGMTSFGGQLFIPVGDNVTLNYHFGIGTSTRGGFYVHATGGMVGGLSLISSVDTTALGAKFLQGVGFFMLFIPEGVGFYLKDEGKWKMHLSLNPVVGDYWKRKQSSWYEETRIGAEIIFRLKYKLNEKFFIAPHLGAKAVYNTSLFGGTIGVTLGLEGTGD